MRTPSHILKEYNLSTDNFNKPEVVTGREAVGLLIVRLILLEPGTNPNRPDMGLGLISKYRTMFPNQLADLRRDLYYQLETYLPDYSNVAITLTEKDKHLVFDITVDDNVYKYITVEQEDNKVTLTEFIEGN